MVLVWLEEEVAPSCAGGGEGRSVLTAWLLVLSCFCLQEAFPGFLSFRAVPPPCGRRWELSTGPESDRLKVGHCHRWVVGALASGESGPEKGSDSLRSHSETVGGRAGLEPQDASLHCSVLPVLRPPAGRRRPVLTAKTQANTFFPSVLTK